MPGILQSLDSLFYKSLRFLGTDRPVNMPCLTETAAAHAAAEKLKIHSVVHDLGGRDDRSGGERCIVKVNNDTLGDPFRCSIFGNYSRYSAVRIIINIIQRRNINALKLGNPNVLDDMIKAIEELC